MNAMRIFGLRTGYDSRGGRCAKCKGTGKITKKDARYRARLKCDACGGTGKVPA